MAVQGTPEQSHKDMRNLVTSSTIWKSCQVSERLMPNIATPRDFLRLCGLEFCSFCSCQVFDLQEHASWAGDFCHHFSDPTRFDSPSSLPHSWVAMDSYLQLISLTKTYSNSTAPTLGLWVPLTLRSARDSSKIRNLRQHPAAW